MRIVLVEGENESGKSTLFEAVYFALYGKPVSEADNSALVHNRATRGLVRLVFSVDDARCEVVRKLSRGAQRVTARGELTVRAWRGHTIHRQRQRAYR